MAVKFTDQAQRAIELAHQEARGFNHGYVGTEHLLLGLLAVDGSIAADVLRRFGADLVRVRSEVERLVLRGPEGNITGEIPLTPRAKHAIDYAIEDVRFMKQPAVDTDHLLVGLIHEPDGVAGKVLRSFGLDMQQLQREVFKLRLLQYKIVERAVRPVRAGSAGKRKIREELLAHLEGIYEDEYARSNDSGAALRAAAERFGEPAELSRELERALPASERRAYYFERWFGWRAPESATRYLVRSSALLGAAFAVICAIGLAATVLLTGRDAVGWKDVCEAGMFVLLVPLGQFLFGLLYLKMRNAFWGAFGSRRSLWRAIGFAALIGVVGFASVISFVAVNTWDLGGAWQYVNIAVLLGVAAASAYLLLARVRGRTEIADAQWELLDVERVQLT